MRLGTGVQAHVVRAMLEAMCFQTREVVDAMCRDAGLDHLEVRVSRSGFLCRTTEADHRGLDNSHGWMDFPAAPVDIDGPRNTCPAWAGCRRHRLASCVQGWLPTTRAECTCAAAGPRTAPAPATCCCSCS